MPPRDIPGYYYDEEKKKYFKIEKNGTVATTHSHSANNLRRTKKIQMRAILEKTHTRSIVESMGNTCISLLRLSTNACLNPSLSIKRGYFQMLQQNPGILGRSTVSKYLHQRDRAVTSFHWAENSGCDTLAVMFRMYDSERFAEAYVGSDYSKEAFLHKSRVAPAFAPMINNFEVQHDLFGDIRPSFQFSAGNDSLVPTIFSESNKCFSTIQLSPQEEVIIRFYMYSDSDSEQAYWKTCLKKFSIEPNGYMISRYCTNATMSHNPFADDLRCLLSIDDKLYHISIDQDRRILLGSSFSPIEFIRHLDPDIYVIGLENGTVEIRDQRLQWKDSTELKTFPKHQISNVRLGYDSHQLIVHGQEKMSMYDLRNLNLSRNTRASENFMPVFDYQGYNNDHPGLGFYFNADLQLLTAANNDGTFGLWSSKSASPLTSYTLPHANDRALARQLQIIDTCNGPQILALSGNTIWNYGPSHSEPEI